MTGPGIDGSRVLDALDPIIGAVNDNLPLILFVATGLLTIGLLWAFVRSASR